MPSRYYARSSSTFPYPRCNSGNDAALHDEEGQEKSAIPSTTAGKSWEVWNPLMELAKEYTPSVTVFLPEGRKSSGNARSFHTAMAMKILNVAVAGRRSGSTTLQNVPKGLHPSIAAASSSSTGMDFRKPV